MEVLSCEKLENINGGGKFVWYALSGVMLFFLGFFNGMVNPSKCN